MKKPNQNRVKRGSVGNEAVLDAGGLSVHFQSVLILFYIEYVICSILNYKKRCTYRRTVKISDFYFIFQEFSENFVLDDTNARMYTYSDETYRAKFSRGKIIRREKVSEQKYLSPRPK